MKCMQSFQCAAPALAFLLSFGMAAQAAQAPGSLRVTSSSFVDGGKIPAAFTCDGANQSPDLQFAAPPAGTRSFAIVVDDPDAPAAFTHWLAYNLSADTRGLSAGTSTPLLRLTHGMEGVNSFGHVGYGGPCPPQGSAHHYVFRVYALDAKLALPAGAATQQVSAAMQGHVLAQGQITGLYSRGGN